MKHSWRSRLRCAARRTAQALESQARVSGWPLVLPLVGMAALIWFAFRVIPKPSRATYPCQRVAAPLASGFLAWLLGAVGVQLALRRARKHLRAARYWAAIAFAFAALVAGGWLLLHSEWPAYADYTPHPANAPMGTARGTHPGRVTWVFDPLATNQASTNTSGDYWWYDEADGTVNTDPARVDVMLSRTLQELTGASSDAEAWDALFRYSNQSRGLGDVGYQPGQKIAIKVNMCSGWPSNVNMTTYQKVNYIGMTDTSPQLMHAMLKQLIEVAGVAPEDISIGDPLRYFFNQFYNKLATDYPTVRYLDHEGKNGRVWAEPSDEPVLKYSDTEDVTRFDKLPKAFIAADYMINMAALKGHDGAGITLCAKNHYGSHAREGAEHLHYTLPGPPTLYGGLTGMGKYRVLVDMMGHKDLGGKTMLFLVDGLWGARHSIANPNKWKSAPFNNRWPSNLLASQDGVALESVGLDLLQAEYNETNYPGETHNPFFDGTEDYIHQAADPANWPAGVTYDPERDGTALGSLGAHEHWNNATDKQYTRNLLAGDGIELITVGDLPVKIAVSATKPAVAEEDEIPGELTISRTGDMSTDVAVSFSLAGTATAGTDYAALPASVSIAAGQSVARLAVAPIDDSLAEGNETVTLTLTAGSGYVVDTTRAAATATIVDNELSPPAAPSNLTAQATSPTEVALAWTDNATNETGFSVERSLSSGSGFGEIASLAANVTSYHDANLTPSTTYYYRVRTLGDGGASDYSNPASATTPPDATGTGLTGKYYDSRSFTGLKVTRTDATIDFDWGAGSPDSSMGVNTFSVRWTGQVMPRYSQTYTFYTQSDDGVRLWVNGQRIINNWTDHASTENRGTITLTAGIKYTIKMDFYENAGNAVAKLSWSSSSQGKEIVPQSRLFP